MKRLLLVMLMAVFLFPTTANAAKHHMTRTEASRWVRAAVIKKTNQYFLYGLDTSFNCPKRVTKRRLRCKIRLSGYFGEAPGTMRGKAVVKLLPHRSSEGPHEYTLRVYGSFGMPGYKQSFDYVGGVKRYYGRYLKNA